MGRGWGRGAQHSRGRHLKTKQSGKVTFSLHTYLPKPAQPPVFFFFFFLLYNEDDHTLVDTSGQFLVIEF